MHILVYTCYAVAALAIIALRVLFSVAVYKDARHKQLKNQKMWLAIVIAFGFIGAVSYAALTLSKDRKSAGRDKIKFAVLFVLLIALLTGACFAYFHASDNIPESFPDDYLTYEVNDETVIYDKMGRTYNYDEWSFFRYYDRDGNAYAFHNDYEDMEYGYKNVETGDFKDSIDTYVDEEGYLVFDTDDSITIYMEEIGDAVYYDNKGNLYYKTEDVCWNDKGELNFTAGYKYAGYSYASVMTLVREQDEKN